LPRASAHHNWLATPPPFTIADQGRGILGVNDGVKTKGIETEDDVKTRKEFLREIGYKL
jgi:adenosine/AMP kinase